jgi:hypothetical protein
VSRLSSNFRTLSARLGLLTVAAALVVGVLPALGAGPTATAAEVRHTARASYDRYGATRSFWSRKPASALTPMYTVEKGLTLRAIALHRATRAKWPQIKTYYGYRNSPGSDHYTGNALDLMIPSYNTTTGKALGQNVANWAVANHQKLGIHYVIWNQQIWNVDRERDGWRAMSDRGSDSANHTDHVHISVF